VPKLVIALRLLRRNDSRGRFFDNVITATLQGQDE
jgi:hypothetical protein